MLKQILVKIKTHLCTDRLYSKNSAVIFFIIAVAFIALFSGERLQVASKQIKNTYLKNIIVDITTPIADISGQLPFELFFTNTRSQLITLLKLENDYHWDNFYYSSKPTYSFSNDYLLQQTSRTQTTDTESKSVNAHSQFANEVTKNKLNIEEQKNTSSLLMVQHEYTKQRPLRILCIGDSQMQNLAEGLKRIVGTDSRFDITDIAVVSSGFIRTDYYNWPAKLQTVFEKAAREKKEYDVALLLLGMNDNQNFFDGNGNLFRFGTTEWINGYENKMTNILNIIQSHVKKVYWIGLPFVKSSSFNASIDIIENAQIKTAHTFDNTKVTHISVRSIANADSNKYSDTIKDDNGKTIQFMKADGTHYTLAGATYIMDKLVTQFYSDFKIEPNF
ncbi:MAG: DUF459 domain-containing protein [Spirochaetaceae bacterium]|nr:DUF459 domain-containing protein [Spirochaetaceae bacterium]